MTFCTIKTQSMMMQCKSGQEINKLVVVGGWVGGWVAVNVETATSKHQLRHRFVQKQRVTAIKRHEKMLEISIIYI